MKRIYARRVVTTMQHLQSYRDGPIMNFPGKTMGPFVLASIADVSIALCRVARSPQPTIIRAALIYLCPEANNKRSFSLVTMNKYFWFSLARFLAYIRVLGNWCSLPTSTLAFTIGRGQAALGDPGGVLFEIVRKIGRWGRMSVHRNLPFCDKPGTLAALPGAFYWVATRSIIPQAAQS